MADVDQIAGNGVVQLVDQLIDQAIRRKASDIHFEPSDEWLSVRYRVDGVLHDIDRLPVHLTENVIARLKVLSGLLTYRKDVPQEGAFRRLPSEGPSSSIDIRVATFPTVRGERAALRLMYEVGQINGLGELGLPDGMVEVLAGAAERPQGLILVTGPAGSGKSTTLYALARHILAATPGRSVVGLEDPVEQRISGVAQIQVQPHGELDYVRAMRSLLRQDVQVLLVGEIRDVETAHIVVEAALTGHLIMSTLHSGDPAEAIIRLVEMGIPPYQLVGALTTVCSQRLLRTICPSCHGQGLPVKIGEAQYGKEGGCPNCMGSGYAGRVACGQVMAMSEALRQAILEHRPAGELRRIIAESGPDLVADAQRLLAEGRTTTEEIQRVLGQST